MELSSLTGGWQEVGATVVIGGRLECGRRLDVSTRRVGDSSGAECGRRAR